MPALPDDALVVRGGLNPVELLEKGSGVTVGSDGRLHGVSVNSAAGKTVAELAAGLQYKKVCVTTAGDIRVAGGTVEPKPTPYNPDHCEINGLRAEVLHKLLMPPQDNPSRVKRVK